MGISYLETKRPSIYDDRTEGVRLRWTHVDRGGVKPHVDVHTEN